MKSAALAAVRLTPPAERPLVRIVNKIFAAIVMGLVGWFVIGFPIMLVVLPSLAADPNPSVGWAFLGPGIAVVATIAVTVFAPTGRVAWGRLCLLNGVVSLGLPLAGIAFSVLLGHHASQLAVSDAAKTGAKIGAGLGGMIVSGTLGVRWLLLGSDFPGARLCHLAERTAPLIVDSRGVIVTPGEIAGNRTEGGCGRRQASRGCC